MILNSGKYFNCKYIRKMSSRFVEQHQFMFHSTAKKRAKALPFTKTGELLRAIQIYHALLS